jgi:amino acid adenylation domain-containing protein
VLVNQFLEQAADRFPDKAALICAGARPTYREIRDRSRSFAQTLVRAGVQPGDRVVICLENSIETVVSIFGVLAAGAVFIVVNPQSRVERLAHVVEHSGASAFVGRPRQVAALAGRPAWPRSVRTIVVVGNDMTTAPSGIDVVPFVKSRNGSRGDRPIALPRRVATDLAALVYTSGSTGIAKGVMLTHRNLVAAADSICTYLQLTPDDVILNALPLSFTYGLGQITTAFRTGATVVLEASFVYPQAIIDTLVRERVTGFPLVPTMATLLLQQRLNSEHFTSLRYITNAAAALPATNVRRLQAAFPNAAIFSMYGQTECQRVSYLPPAWLAARPDSVGVAIPGTRVHVVDDAGRPVAPGTIGELVVEGPHVMAGYWNDPDATRQALRPGPGGEPMLYTGDLFRTDDDGCLYFVDRRDDIIKTRGEKVAPRTVEEAIAAMPGVAEVAVFGVPDELLGEAVAAVITPHEGAPLTRERVRQYCRRHLEDFMIPTIVDIRDALPTTLSGKVNRRELRELALQAQGPLLSEPAQLRVEGPVLSAPPAVPLRVEG